MRFSLLAALVYGVSSSCHSNPADMVTRWRNMIRSFSGVRRSAYSGKNDRTGSSIPLMMPRSMAMPSSKAITLFVAERSSCRTAGPNATLPSGRPHASSLPEKYCSKTSEPCRATSTAWTLLSFDALSQLTIGQSTALARPTLSGAATDHWSVLAIGKLQLSWPSASGGRMAVPIATISAVMRMCTPERFTRSARPSSAAVPEDRRRAATTPVKRTIKGLEPVGPRSPWPLRKSRRFTRSPRLPDPMHCRKKACLFDYPIGTGEQRGRDGEPKRVCSLHINKQLVLRCLIDRNVPRRCAIKDLSNVPHRTGPQFHKFGRLGHETTAFNVLAIRVNCRQSIFLGQLDDQSAVHQAFRFGAHIERVGVFLRHHLEHTSIFCLLKGAFRPGDK